MAYGVGMFAQGGMGTEYGGDSFLAAGSGEKVRSELSVGRLIAPFAYEVNNKLSIAASADLVWAGLDLKMALPGSAFLDMSAFPGSTQTYGTVSGSMLDAFGSLVFGGGAFPAGTLNPANPVNYGRFDFSDNSDFTGKAMGYGFAGKIGGVYKINDAVSVGLAYHSKTAISDLETNGAQISFNANVDSGIAGGGAPNGIYVPATIPLTGKIKVKDFQWPQMIGAGVAYQATDALMVVFDYKWINWADVMKDFKMVFTADTTQSNPIAQQVFGGTELDATLFQKWKDQHVFMIGAGYKINPEWVVRAGLNITNNPIPDTYLNALFPAIEKNHVTVGAGYMISKASSVDASFAYAPEVKQTAGANGEGPTITHSQTNAQVMYSYRF
jgi:long-chain fatty acid transport protein